MASAAGVLVSGVPGAEHQPRSQAGRLRSFTPGWSARVLRVPLLWKLFGANAIVVLTAAGAALAQHAGEPRLLATMIAALLATFAVNGGLVYLALRPLAELETAARRVSRGEMAVRVRPSALADRNMARIGCTINRLVDRLTSDRAKMRTLAAQVIRAEERERARIARELHDSTAQTLAALSLQATAAMRDSRDPAFDERLALIKLLASDALDEVRTLAYTIYPRVLDDLGLRAALDQLARQWRSEAVRIAVEAVNGHRKLPREVEAVLYQVAREALSNALRHGEPRQVTIALTPDLYRVTLEIVDNGSGFDPANAIGDRSGIGLFSMAERVSLVDGTFALESTPGSGTRVTVSIPLGAGE